MVLDATGIPHVAYLDATHSVVRLRKGTPQAPFTFKSTADVVASSDFPGVSLAFDPFLLDVYLGYASADGPQVFVAQ